MYCGGDVKSLYLHLIQPNLETPTIQINYTAIPGSRYRQFCQDLSEYTPLFGKEAWAGKWTDVSVKPQPWS